MASGLEANNSQQGYSCPDPQSPKPAEATESQYFVTDKEWEELRKAPKFDFIVVGSGLTALAFVEKTLSNNPLAKVLLLERGGFWLPEHFQNLPPAYQVLGNPEVSETFPFRLSEAMHEQDHLRFMHGSCPFFGGRSLFWSAWSPDPVLHVNGMGAWPPFLVDLLSSQNHAFWDAAKSHLNVTAARHLNDTIYGDLQYELEERLEMHRSKVPSADQFISAPMAVGNRDSIGQRFEKFSTPGPLLHLQQQQKVLEESGKGSALKLVLGCAVEQLQADKDGVVTSMKTSKGQVAIGNAKIILCMGCIPPCTLLLNSFPNNKNLQDLAGKRLTGHFLSHIVARIPRKSFRSLRPGLELGALYVGGRLTDDKGKASSDAQYHIQISAISSQDPARYSKDAARECPDLAGAITPAQLKGSEEYVLLTCAAVGELALGEESWVKKHGDTTDLTCNVEVQVKLQEQDRKLWDFMEAATLQAIMAMATDRAGKSATIEYWHDEPATSINPPSVRPWRQKGLSSTGQWKNALTDKTALPDKALVREQGVVHEASCLWMGEEQGTSVVQRDFRPWGVQNVYITGASLFPSSGSWNPTLTIVGLAQQLAENLAPPTGPGHNGQKSHKSTMAFSRL